MYVVSPIHLQIAKSQTTGWPALVAEGVTKHPPRWLLKQLLVEQSRSISHVQQLSVSLYCADLAAFPAVTTNILPRTFPAVTPVGRSVSPPYLFPQPSNTPPLRGMHCYGRANTAKADAGGSAPGYLGGGRFCRSSRGVENRFIL